MDYDFIHHIQQLGFYDAFKHYVEDTMIDVLNQSIYQGIKDHIIHRFSSTPLTIKRLSGNHEGGITGWAFTNNEILSESNDQSGEELSHPYSFYLASWSMDLFSFRIAY
jgi:hypothetical protein